jgi:hypothetical protein
MSMRVDSMLMLPMLLLLLLLMRFDLIQCC